MPDPVHALVGRRILVVEDEYLIAIEVKRWLEQAGATVVGPVPSVDQALDVIADDRLDAAVLDVNLGAGSMVYPAAGRLDALGVPYLFASGVVDVSRQDGHRDQPLLEKPYLEDELVRAVAELLL
ncbi:hypothetical protein ADL19_05600 [Streptomyces purpurogeneiscleroticus]|nr:hypothetical protein ADL19_05600 [Streptomyces purpurogeneiscleroticus]